MDNQTRLSQNSTAPQTMRAYYAQQGQQLLDALTKQQQQAQQSGQDTLHLLQNQLQGYQQQQQAQLLSQQQPQDTSSGSLNFTAPVADVAGPQRSILGQSGPITQPFGNENPGVEVFSHGFNSGTDIGVPVGTSVALPEGQWQIAQAFTGDQTPGHIGDSTNEGYGNSVLAQNLQTGEKLRFSHLSRVGVKPGQIVRGGNIVGDTGMTGNVTGPHLDLEYYNALGQLADVLRSRYGNQLGISGVGAGGKGGGNPFGGLLNSLQQIGGSFAKGYMESPGQVQGDTGSPESLGNFVANGTPTGEVGNALGQGLHALSQAAPMAAHALPALPFVTGALRDATPEVRVADVPGVKYKPVTDLITHEATDPRRVAQYKALIQQGGEVPPLMVTAEDGALGVKDGQHRLQALKQLGQQFVPTVNLSSVDQDGMHAYNRALDLAHQTMQALSKAKK